MNASDYFVSIITVVKNEPEGLENTIKSVLQQTYRGIEYIVIDGKSDDDTIDVINTYKNSISQLVSEPDTGIYNAMNKGIKIATGEYLLFLNTGDSLASSDTIEKIYTQAKDTHPTPSVIYGGVNVYDEQKNFITSLKPLKLKKTNLNMFATRVVCHQSILVKCDKAPLYNEKYKLKSEYDWYYNIIKTVPKERILTLKIPISNYLLGGVSMTQQKRNFREMVQVVRAHNNLCMFLFYSPFFLIPAIFRLKRRILNILK